MTAWHIYPFPACSVSSFIHIFHIIGVAFDPPVSNLFIVPIVLPAHTPCLPHAVGSRRGLPAVVLVAPLVLAILPSGLLVSTRRRLMLLLVLQRSFSMFLGRPLPMPVPPLPPPSYLSSSPLYLFRRSIPPSSLFKRRPAKLALLGIPMRLLLPRGKRWKELEFRLPVISLPSLVLALTSPPY